MIRRPPLFYPHSGLDAGVRNVRPAPGSIAAGHGPRSRPHAELHRLVDFDAEPWAPFDIDLDHLGALDDARSDTIWRLIEILTTEVT